MLTYLHNGRGYIGQTSLEPSGQTDSPGVEATPDANMIALVGETYLQKMKAIGSTLAFAVTSEPEGGSVTFTLEKLTVQGKMKA